MHTVIGSALGGLVAGAMALGAVAVMKPAAAEVSASDRNGAYAATVSDRDALNDAPQFAGPRLQCQPYEEAVLRRAVVNGREVADVTCITRMNGAVAQNAYAQPIAYQQPVYRDQMVTRPAARTAPARAARNRAIESRRESGRSWGKTAMIIGGSAGGGAGIGGLIGGKKGALIGAALGGGAATIYEARKR